MEVHNMASKDAGVLRAVSKEELSPEVRKRIEDQIGKKYSPGAGQMSMRSESIVSAAQVSISAEGMRSLKEGRLQGAIDELGNTNVMLTDHSLLLSSKLPSDYGEADANGEYHVISRCIGERADNLLAVYAEAYDEIQRGYEDGTRETYIRDEGAEKGFRKLTRDEEIAELDKAFENMAARFDRRNSREVIDALAANAKKVAEISSGRAKMSTDGADEFKRRQEERSKLPDDLGSSIVAAAKAFVGQYSRMEPGGADIKRILGGMSVFGDR